MSRAFQAERTARAKEPGGESVERKRAGQRGVRGESCVGVSGVGTSSGALEVIARTWAVTPNETEGKTHVHILSREGVSLQLL